MTDWSQQLVQSPQNGIQILDWWEKELAHLPKKIRKIKAATMMYCAWNLWKERNRRVFEQKIKSPAEVIQEIKHEVHTRKLACLGPELS